MLDSEVMKTTYAFLTEKGLINILYLSYQIIASVKLQNREKDSASELFSFLSVFLIILFWIWANLRTYFLGLFSGTYENFGEKLYTLWFRQYERATGVLSSSGFEHVFIGINICTFCIEKYFVSFSIFYKICLKC